MHVSVTYYIHRGVDIACASLQVTVTSSSVILVTTKYTLTPCILSAISEIVIHELNASGNLDTRPFKPYDYQYNNKKAKC